MLNAIAAYFGLIAVKDNPEPLIPTGDISAAALRCPPLRPEENEWKQVMAGSKDDGKTPYGHDARSVMYHDPTSGHGLLLQFEINTIWAYDPDSVKWTKLAPEGDPMPTGGKRLAYLDPALNALVVLDGTAVWAYRYQAA